MDYIDTSDINGYVAARDVSEDCANLIVAAVNALPALLAVAEAAAIALPVAEQSYCAAEQEFGSHTDDSDRKAIQGLEYALSLLPNAKISGPAPEVSDV